MKMSKSLENQLFSNAVIGVWVSHLWSCAIKATTLFKKNLMFHAYGKEDFNLQCPV